MAFYVQIKDTVYKVPKRIVIGRGEPFTILNEEFSVARAHLQVVRRGRKWTIRQLERNVQTLHNGVLLADHRNFKYCEGDELSIGGVPVSITRDCPEGVLPVEIQRFNSNYNIWNSGEAIAHVILIFAIVAVFITTQKYTLTMMAAMVISWFMVASGIRMIFRILYWMMQAQTVREVYMNHDGFTAHYLNDHNMTFKVNQIQSWYIRHNTLHVKIYDQDYSFLVNKGHRPLLQFFESQIPERKVTPVRHLPMPYRLGPVGLAVLDYFFISEEMYAMFMLGALVMLFMLFNAKARTYWPVKISRVYSEKTRRQHMVFALIALLFLAYRGFDEQYTPKRIPASSKTSR